MEDKEATTLLAIDIGGTKCELAVFPVMKTVPGKPLVKKRYLSEEHSCLEDIVSDFLLVAGAKPEYACVGVAGVVSGGVGTVTNHPWVLKERDLIRSFNFKKILFPVHLILRWDAALLGTASFGCKIPVS